MGTNHTENRWLKNNAIKLAKHHRKYCEGESCDISLYALGLLLKRAKISLTKEEVSEFV